MTTIVWLLSLTVFVGAGLVTWRIDEVARLDLPARISIAFCCGLLFVSSLLFVESILRVRWSLATVGVPLIALTAAGLLSLKRRISAASETPWERGPALAFAAVAAISVYGAAGARMTIADLLYFWGPKAVHFFHARAIDVEFLKFPHYYLMHPDYPPLVPLTWAASALVAGKVSYWGAVCATPILLVAACLTFRGFAAPVLGAAKSSAFATLLLAVLTVAVLAGSAAGGGDAYLLLFETVALSAVTFSNRRGATVVAALALAGAAFAKVEGAAFVAAMGAAMIFTGRVRAGLAVTLPAVALLGSWIGFAQHHELLDSYARGERRVHFNNLVLVLRHTAAKISYGAFYLPWIGALAPLAGARSFRRAALPLLAGLASIAYTLYFYLGEPDPVWWIHSSAERVLATTLLCFVVASAAASE